MAIKRLLEAGEARIRHIGRVLSDRRWLAFYLQRRLLNPARRRAIADHIARRRGGAGASRPDALSEQGLLPLGQLLTSSQCDEVRRHLANKPVLDEYRPRTPAFRPLSEARDPLSHVAHHRPEDVIAAPHLLDLANSAEILGRVEQFLGCRPTISYMAAWWSYPTPIGPQQAELFHRDIDDWRFVKLFVYLCDVGPANGPHIYVKGSANSARLCRIGRFRDEDVEEAYPGQTQAITGAAGTAFLEDTFGLHRGAPVETAGPTIPDKSAI